MCLAESCLKWKTVQVRCDSIIGKFYCITHSTLPHSDMWHPSNMFLELILQRFLLLSSLPIAYLIDSSALTVLGGLNRQVHQKHMTVFEI